MRQAKSLSKSPSKSLICLALSLNFCQSVLAAGSDIAASTDVYIDPPMSASLKAMKHQASILIERNGTHQARVLIAKYGKEHNYPEEFFLITAYMFIAKHAYKEAGQYLQDGLKKYPKSFDLHLTLAQNWIIVDEPDLAEPELDYCMKLKPDAQAVYADRANLAYTREDYKEALKQSDLALSKGPGTKQIWQSRACILRNMKRDKESLEALNKAMALCSPAGEWDLRHIRATQLQSLGRYKEAINDYQFTLAGDDVHKYIHNARIGECYLALKQPKEALRYFDKAILSKGDYFAAHRGRLSCLTMLNDKHAADEERRFIKDSQGDFKPIK